MGIFSALLGGDEWRDKPPEEKRADIARHKSLRQAAEQAGKSLRDECPATNALNSGVIDAERDVPWWRR